ncbi:MAG: hypothetical protein JXR77_03580 [Lentisphaeria bacterium]|nr:hypothetical protein [Lentisphaeria bacterium]
MPQQHRWLCVGLGAATVSVGAEAPDVMRAARRLEDTLWQRFVDQRTGNVRTRNSGGRSGRLEDTSLYGGILLAALVESAALDPSPRNAQRARQIAAGLFANAAAGEPGFVARGVEPEGGGFLGDPSVDQVTGLLYGLWRYSRSVLPSARERVAIRRLFEDVLKRLERDGFAILREDRSGVTTFGHLNRIQPTRAERLLAFLLGAYDVTGNEYWFELYETMRTERMAACRGYGRIEPWVLIQTAMSLDMLRRLEERHEVRTVYLAGLTECAECCRPFLDDYRQGLPNLTAKDSPELVRTVRNPVEAITVVLLAEGQTATAEVAGPLNDLLEAIPAPDIENSVSLCSLLWNCALFRRQRVAKESH